MSAESDTDAMLDQLAEEFVARTRSGEQPSVTEYTERHPEHADDIREIFPLLCAMESAKGEKPLAGTRVGPYEIVREIGRGGMGIVYEAVQTELGRRVALKILPVQATLDARFLERFRLEAQAAAKLEHAHIVPVIGYGTDGDLHYYSMQYIDGRGLDQVIEEIRSQEDLGNETRGRDDYRRIARIGRQLARAMAHAHEQGILHRDLKPTNVLLDKDEHAWITDFGLCYQTDSEGLTRTGDILGTFRYMPPERFSGVSDARGDIYGIGITLYEMLTRRRAYEADDAAVLAARIPNETPPRPRTVEPRIPQELALIVRKAMAHDPAQRYATADALAHDLDAFLSNQPIAARAPTAGYVLRKAIARHRTLTITVGLAIATLIGSTIWYVRDLQRKEDLARRGQYAASVSAASAALRTSDVHQAAALLEDAPAELRNWEWRYLHSRLHSELRVFPGLPKRVSGLAISRDGAYLASGFERELLVHDYESGALLQTLALGGRATRLAWSPDGTRLAVGLWTGFEVWSWPEAERLVSISAGDHRWIGFAKSGAEILAGVVDGRVVRYDASTGEEVRTYAFPHRVLGFAADDPWSAQRVAVSTADGHVTVLRLADGEVLWTDDTSNVNAAYLAFHTTEQLVAADAGKLVTWNATTGAPQRTFGLGGKLGPLVQDPVHQRLVVHRGDAILALDPLTGHQLQTLAGRANGQRAVIHPDGRRLVLGAQSGLLHEWYLGDERDPLVLARHMDDVISMDIHPEGRFVAAGGFGGVLRIWDLDAGELARAHIAHVAQVESVRYSPSGKWLASADLTGEVQLRRVGADAATRRWQAAPRGAIRLAFLPGESGLLTFGHDGRLNHWSLEDGRLLRSTTASENWDEYQGGFPHLTTSRSGRWIACSRPGGSIRIFSAGRLEISCTIAAHVEPVTGIAFHPHRDILGSASRDRSLRLWHARTGEAVARHEPLESGLAGDIGFNGLSFSPDGSRLASGSFTGALTLWDAATMRPITTLDATTWITTLGFGPAGTRLITAHSGGRLRVWDSAPVASRVETYQAHARARASARPLVADLLTEHGNAEAALVALRQRADLAAETKEAGLRLLQGQRASHEGLIARLWRDLVPRDTKPERLVVDRALAEGLWRASKHQNRPDPPSDTLLGLAYLRSGDHENALRVFDRIAARNKGRARALYAIDLAVAVMAHRALDQAPEAQSHLELLEALLAETPALRTPNVQTLLVEARGN